MPYGSGIRDTIRKPLFTPGMKVNWEHPLNRGLLIWHMFTGGGSTVFYPVTGGEPSTLSGGSYSGGILSLVNTGADYLAIPQSLFSALWTCHVSIYTTATASNGTRLTVLSDRVAGGNGWGCRVYATGASLPFKPSLRQNGVDRDGAIANIPFLAWCDVVWAFNGTNCQMYINGLWSEDLSSGAVTTQTKCYLGYNPDVPSTGTAFKCRSMSFYNRCLAPAEILLLTSNHYGTPDNPRLI